MADSSEEVLPPEPRGPGQTLVRALRSYWPWVLVGAVAFAVVAFAVSAERSSRYRASGNVFLVTAEDAPVPVEGQTVDPVRRVRNEAEVMMSRDVASRVSRRLGTMPTADVLSAVEATPSTNTDIVTLRATAGSVRESVRLLNAVEAAYENLTRERAQGVYQNALAQLERNRTDLETRLRAVQGTLAADPNNAEAARQRDLLSQDISSTQEQATELSLKQLNAERPVRLFAPFDPATSKISPNPLRNAALGALLGAFVATLLVWWRASRAQFAMRPSVAAGRLGVPLLGDVPAKQPRRPAGSGARPRDTYHWILAMVDRAVQECPSKVIVVTGADDTSASASVIVNLAAAAVDAGRPALLVDADARTAFLTTALNADTAPGFSEVAGEGLPVADVGLTRTIDGTTIQFVPVGTLGRGTGAIDLSRRAIDALRAFDEAAGEVYLHLPPLPTCPETAVLAQEAAGLVAVVRPRTPLGSIDRLGAVAEAFDLNMLGYVFDRSVWSGPGPRAAADDSSTVSQEPAAAKSKRLVPEQDLAT
jgi:capsular polysaccharide biosynthesis protein/Mrp family chromosome partitioning ATPase